MSFIDILWLLTFAHFVADFPLQGDFLARAKNRTAPIPGVPWAYALSAHAFIHAGFVALITGHLWLGVAEFVLHATIDDAKCRGKLDFEWDQACHLICKVAWALIAWRLAQ